MFCSAVSLLTCILQTPLKLIANKDSETDCYKPGEEAEVLLVAPSLAQPAHVTLFVCPGRVKKVCIRQ